MIHYEPAWRRVIALALQEMAEDNIQYAEIRSSLPQVCGGEGEGEGVRLVLGRLVRICYFSRCAFFDRCAMFVLSGVLTQWYAIFPRQTFSYQSSL